MKKIFAILLSFQFILAPLAYGEDNKDKYYVTGDGSSEGNKQYINSIMMTGSAAIGSNFMTCQSGVGNNIPTFSHYIFLGGAVVLLLAEIVAATKQQEAKKESEQQLARQGIAESKPGDYTTQEQKDTQLTLLNTAKDEETKNRDALKARMDWMTAVEVVYWLAVAGAAVEVVLYALTKIPAYGQAIGYNDWSLTCNNDSISKGTVMMIGAAYGAIPGLIGGDIGGALMGGISVAGFMAILQMIVGKVGLGIKAAVNSAPGRIIIFGVFAALATTVRNGLKDRVNKANENIALIEKSISSWTEATTVTNEITTPQVQPPTMGGGTASLASPTTKPNTVAQLPTTKPIGKCLSSGSSGLVHSASGCSRPLTFNRSAVNFNNKFLNGAANQSFDMAESFARDDMSGAQMHAAGLTANAAKVKAEAMNMIKAANKELKARGDKEIDFDKEVKAQLANFTQVAQDAASQNGMKGFSGAPLANNGSDTKTSPADKASAVDTQVPVVSVPSSAPNLALGSPEVPVEVAAGADQSLEDKLKDFEPTQSEISKQVDVSIFKLLSHRYNLSYDKIMTRKKEVKIEKEEKK